MSKIDIPRVADGLTAYAIERQNGMERHQPPGSRPWMERRRFWIDAILQGMVRLEGLTPDPGLMERYDRRLEEARGCSAAETLPAREQAALIRGLRQYISALEATGEDRRRQIAVVGELLEDMAVHLSWNDHGSGLSLARDEADRALVRITAQMPIRFTRILMGGDAGPHWACGFVPGAVKDIEAVKKTGVYAEAVRDYPEIASWPSLCAVYVGRGLDCALGTTDASPFDLEIMNRTGDRFLKEQGVHCVGGPYQLFIPVEMQANRSPEPDQDGPAPQMELTM